MEPTPLCEFLTVALTTPLGIPATVSLINKWRVSRRAVYIIGTCLVAALALAYFVVFQLWGDATWSTATVGIATPLLCWSFYIIFVGYRDGRLLFTIVTGLGLALMTESLAIMLAPRGTPLWVLCKIGLTVVQFLLVFFVCKRPFLRMLEVSDTGWFTMSLVPLTMLASIGYGYMYPTIRLDESPRKLPLLLILTAAVVFYVMLYRFLYNLQNQNQTARNYALLHAQMRFLEQQADLVRENAQETRAFRHDLRHYTELLRSCIDRGDSTTAIALLDGIEYDAGTRLPGQLDLREYTGNPIVDAVLSLTAGEAEAAGITFEVQMDWPERFGADVVQFGVVLSNVLENALNACRRVPWGQPRIIRVNGSIAKDQFYLSVSNTFTGSVAFDPDTGMPVAQRRGHGYGVLSVAAFAKNYGAVVQYSTDEGWFHFAILV